MQKHVRVMMGITRQRIPVKAAKAQMIGRIFG
jgi:hypothetical protein